MKNTNLNSAVAEETIHTFEQDVEELRQLHREHKSYPLKDRRVLTSYNVYLGKLCEIAVRYGMAHKSVEALCIDR